MNSGSSKTGAVTMADLARELGMTKATVSYALNGKAGVSQSTRENVLATAQRMGFHINPLAQRLARGHDNSHIDLIALQLTGGVMLDKLRAIQNSLTERGYSVPLHSYSMHGTSAQGSTSAQANIERKVELVRLLRQTKPRAIVLSSCGVDELMVRELALYQEEGGIVVVYDDALDLDCDCVTFDGGRNVALAARHLLEQGHQRIGLFLQGAFLPQNDPRAAAFGAELQEAGIKVRDEWIWGSKLAGMEAGRDLAAHFLGASERPTALVIVNDDTAVSFSALLARQGWNLPGDLSIVGQDDAPSARYAPVPLSTVTHPAYEIAQRTIELLLSRIEDGFNGASRHVEVRGQLIPRESVRSLTV